MIGIIGLGYVGLPLAVEFGKKYETYGYDIDSSRIGELQIGSDRTLECDSEEILSAVNLKFTSEIRDLQSCSFLVVTVPTPVDSHSIPDLTPLKEATRSVSDIMRPGVTIIYESTVFPGAVEEVCVPILEKHSGLEYNKEFFVGYSPERINPGDKKRKLVNIKKLTSGSTPAIAQKIDDLYSSIILAGTWKCPSIKVAEAAKVIENTQRDINIAFVNELSMIFSKLNINTKDVLDAARTKWNFLDFVPGLVGGHCIGVDPYYLAYKAQEVGYVPRMLLSGRQINESMAEHAVCEIMKRLTTMGKNLSDVRVAIFGVTFKENCPDYRNSKCFDMIQQLEQWGVKPKIYDPWVDIAKLRFDYGIEVCSRDELIDLDCIIITVAHEQFCSLSPTDLEAMTSESGSLIADLKSIYRDENLDEKGFLTFRL